MWMNLKVLYLSCAPCLSSCCLLHHFTNYLLIIGYLETRDPLTAEELEEKERLLEEVNGMFKC